MNTADFWKPWETQIDSFDDLVDAINKMTVKAVKNDRQFAWRGQVDADWALHSSLYRRIGLTKLNVPKEKDVFDEESRVLTELHRWGLHSPPHAGRLSILNQLAMLQHYGSPTRLVDISFNAWVGIWFAVEEKWSNGVKAPDTSDARLFAIDVTDRLINEKADLRSWEDQISRPWKTGGTGGLSKEEWTTSVYAWKPSALDSRIFAQNGGFLFGGVPASSKPAGKKFQFPKAPNNSLGWWTIEEGRSACCLALRPHSFTATAGAVQSGALYTFRIAAGAKSDIRQRLEKMFGYRHSTIYPDFTGFAGFGTRWLKSY